MRVIWACILLVVTIGAWSAWRTLAPGAMVSAGGPRAEDGLRTDSRQATPDSPTIEDAALDASPPRAGRTFVPTAAENVALAVDEVAPSPRGALPVPPAGATSTTDPAAAAVSASSASDSRVITLDNRFTVRGSGTENDPLRIPWALLVSAQETYDPQQGKDELPSRVTQLSGQIVKITGYFAAGVLEDDTRDLIVMLNKWDGCCLGVPPTPYDAVEVKLAEPVKLRGKHMLRYGTVTGRFEVSPFLVAGWLMSVYRIVDAKLEWGG